MTAAGDGSVSGAFPHACLSLVSLKINVLLQTVKEKMVKNYLKKRNLPSKGRIEKKPRRQSRSVFCWGPGRER